MRIVYVLLSPTLGMHHYTGDLAAQMLSAGHEIHVVTTTTALTHRRHYPAAAVVHAATHQHSTGFALDGLRVHELWRVCQRIAALQPNVVHFSGVHLWNPLLMSALHRCGLPVVLTLHDLDPHPDVPHGSLIRLWNRTAIASTNGLIVHGIRYRERLLAAGRQPATVIATPLLHSFLAAAEHARLTETLPEVAFEPWALFFGRIERYKGVEVLLRAQHMLAQQARQHRLIIAGGGDFGRIWPNKLPADVTLLNRRIESDEGSHLFMRCAVLVLPYTGATQSALPATAYAFGKPVIVTTSGALPELVQPGVTGWVVPSGDSKALADCLSGALDNPDRLATAGAAGRRWYEQARRQQQTELGHFYAATSALR